MTRLSENEQMYSFVPFFCNGVTNAPRDKREKTKGRLFFNVFQLFSLFLSLSRPVTLSRCSLFPSPSLSMFSLK